MTATTATTTGPTTTTAGVRSRRPLLPLANLVLAGAALTVSVIAITSDDDATPSTVAPAVAVQGDPAPAAAQPPVEPAAPARVRRSADPAGDCLSRAIVVRC